MDQQAIFLTFRLATLTTLILLAISVPLGYWLAYGRARWKPLVEAAVALPLVLPPTVLGFYLLVLMGPRTAVGRALSAVFGHPLAFSFAGLLVGSVIFSLPFAVQPMTSGFRSVDREILEAAELLSPRPGQDPGAGSAAAGPAFPADRGGAGLYPHGGRVRGGADDWRRHSRA